MTHPGLHDPGSAPAAPALPPVGLSEFAERFRESRGRAPRILHVGNIANNAYLNSKILRRAGYESFVLCHDYTHIMGCPEWEDADWEGSIGDHFHPDWDAVDLGPFERPDWFFQGPLAECADRISPPAPPSPPSPPPPTPPAESIQDQETVAALTIEPAIEMRQDPIRRALRAVDGLFPSGSEPCMGAARRLNTSVLGPAARLPGLLREHGFRAAKAVNRSTLRINRGTIDRALFFVRRAANPLHPGAEACPMERMGSRFRELFPDRADTMRAHELAPYFSGNAVWSRILDGFDAVVGYSTDGCWPLIAGKRPYVSFEHGTIRALPFEDNAGGRLCALTYREADHVIITNSDNITAAQRLGLERFTFVPHPVNEDFLETDRAAELRDRMRAELDADTLVFHPARQHWGPDRDPSWEKGNDILIRGFARFVREVNPRAGAVFVDWGLHVDDSRALLEELGVADRVMWIDPVPNRTMLRYIVACDVVADQFYLGAFGSLTPKALMIGRPTLLRLDVDRHEWCFNRPPPVLNTSTPDEVFESLRRLAQDPGFAERVARDSMAWYREEHSNALIGQRFEAIFSEILADRIAGEPGAAGA